MRARSIETPDQLETHRVGRFIDRHERCGGTFAVQRRARYGNGGVRIACAVCGEGADCDPSHPGLLKLADEVPERRRRKPTVSATELQKWLPAPAALPRWAPNAYIGVIIAAGLALIAFGFVAPNDRDDRVVLAPPPSQPPQDPVSPPVETGPNVAGGAGVVADPDKPQVAAGLPRWVKRRGQTLNRVEFADRFAIGVPSGWTGGTSVGGAVVFSEPGRSAELRVYLEAVQTGLGELTRKTRAYLADRRPGADILGPERRDGGRPPRRGAPGELRRRRRTCGARPVGRLCVPARWGRSRGERHAGSRTTPSQHWAASDPCRCADRVPLRPWR